MSPVTQLPGEVLMHVCAYMGPLDLARCLRLSWTFYGLASTDELWEVHCKGIFARQGHEEDGYLRVCMPMQSHVADSRRIRRSMALLQAILPFAQHMDATSSCLSSCS